MAKNKQAEMLSKMEVAEVRSLSRCFQSHDCFMLPRPVEQDALLREVEKMQYKDLTEPFRYFAVVVAAELHDEKTEWPRLQ